MARARNKQQLLNFGETEFNRLFDTIKKLPEDQLAKRASVRQVKSEMTSFPD
jgi:hypothetical protein